VCISALARRWKFKLHSHLLRMSHHVEYRTQMTQISVPVSATRKTWSRFHHHKRCFILKHSYQDQTTTLLVRALREKATCLPQSSLAKDNIDVDAVAAAATAGCTHQILYVYPLHTSLTGKEHRAERVRSTQVCETCLLAYLPSNVCRKPPCGAFVHVIVEPNANISMEMRM
jgi:hypothetical protein